MVDAFGVGRRLRTLGATLGPAGLLLAASACGGSSDDDSPGAGAGPVNDAQTVLAAALDAALADPDDELLAVACLATACRAGGEVARIAHQVHGAIGVTREMGLERLTRRLWAWRNLPPESESEGHLGRAVLAGGEESAWRLGSGDE